MPFRDSVCLLGEKPAGYARQSFETARKAKDITPSIAWRREAWTEDVLDDLPSKDERGPSFVRPTLEPFQRQRWGNF